MLWDPLLSLRDFDDLTLTGIFSLNSPTYTVKSKEEFDQERKRANTFKLVDDLSSKL